MARVFINFSFRCFRLVLIFIVFVSFHHIRIVSCVLRASLHLTFEVCCVPRFVGGLTKKAAGLRNQPKNCICLLTCVHTYMARMLMDPNGDS